jgi:DNA repair protein RadC
MVGFYRGVPYRRGQASPHMLTSPENVFNLLQCSIKDQTREEFWALLLDGQKRLIEIASLSKDSIRDSQIYPREVLKTIINHGAVSIILVHNHPSGNPTPSQGDRTITKRFTKICNTIDVLVLDHIIIGGNDHFSFAQYGLILDQ